MLALTKTSVPQSSYFNTKSILLSFLQKTWVTCLYSFYVRFTSNNKS